MQGVKKPGALVREDSMETQGISCSSPYSSQRAQGRLKKTWMEVIRQDIEAKGLSEGILLDRNEWRKLIHVPDPAVSEVHEDILNVSPQPSHCNPNVRVDRRLHYQNSLCIPEMPLRSSCSNYMGSTEVPLQKSAAELIKEISTLEIEVVHLERNLLTLYRTAFDRYLASSPTTQSSRSPVEYHTRPLVQDPSKILSAKQEIHAASYFTNGQMDQSHSFKRTEGEKDIQCRHIEASPSHDAESGTDTSSDPSPGECPGSDTSSDPSPRECPKYEEPKSMPSHRSLADHLGASIADHVPHTPSKLSEDIVRCICAIYCKLATSPTQQMDLLVSPTTSASSSSTLSPRDACDSWSPRCHYEAATSPCSFGSPKDKQSPYSSMVEIPKISIDGDRFGYASKMLNIFRSLIRRLDKINPERMDHEEQLAFWINIHNALVMHAFLAYGLHQNQMKRSFSILKAAYDIGGHSVNAYVIQSSILGCQLHRPALGVRSLLSPKFKKGKDKHPYALKHPEPLAHFALCLGAYSDPAVRAYTAKNIHQDLKLAKEEFIQANVRVQKESKIMLPKILCYYTRDAPLELSALVEMVSACMSEDLRKSIQRCLLQRKLDKCVDWSPYKSSFRYLVHRDLAKN